ncbi:MAG: hypothetical protein HUK17_05885 [Bacteroidales bacterium]|nr:hypothetical protein [Bacteroidales bacterium]
MRAHLLLIVALLSLLTAKADGPFRAHRQDIFHVLPIGADNVVFLGNSITNMHPWCEAWGDARVLNRGTSGALSGELIEHLDPIIAGHPKELYLMVGTNDADDTELIINNTRTILQRLTTETPQTRLFLQTLLASDVGKRSIAFIEETNRRLAELIEREFPQVTLVDTYHAVTGILDGTHSNDRLHLSAEGYRQWMIEIQRVGGMEGYTIQYDSTCRGRDYVMSGSNGMRNSYFANLPVMGDDILFVGDEFVCGGEWAELLGDARVKNRGYMWGFGGLPYMHYANSLPYILGRNRKESVAPKQILLYAGSYEVANGVDFNLENYKTLVDIIRLTLPDARLTLVSLVPHPDRDVAPLNAYMQRLAKADPMIDYADICTGMEAYMKGPYVMGEGYLHAAKILKEHIVK